MLGADLNLPKRELKIVLPKQDDELADELRGTTETRTASGHSVYHPAVKDEEHDSDACLSAGTMIALWRGLVPIEEVRVGDWVWTRDCYHQVIACGMSNPDADVYMVIFSDGRELKGTYNHLVFVPPKGFVPLGTLQEGDLVYTNKNIKVTAVGYWGRESVYNLSVEKQPEYFANGILVHNCRYATLAMLAALPLGEHQSPIVDELGWTGPASDGWSAPWGN